MREIKIYHTTIRQCGFYEFEDGTLLYHRNKDKWYDGFGECLLKLNNGDVIQVDPLNPHPHEGYLVYLVDTNYVYECFETVKEINLNSEETNKYLDLFSK